MPNKTSSIASRIHFYVVTRFAELSVEGRSEAAERERIFFDKVTDPRRALIEIDDVIDVDRNVSCEQYISTRHSINVSSETKERNSQFGNLKKSF
jgi:hypothetical protein